MEPSLWSCWILLVLLTALRANAKNEDAQAVSFTPADERESKMFLDFTIQQTSYANNVLEGNISFRLRTWQSDALVFYFHDQSRNFVQMQMKGGRFLLKYNYGDAVIDFLSWQYVNDGKWHTVHVGKTVITVDGKVSLNPNIRGSLPASSYARTTKLRPKENIRLLQVPRLTYSIGGLRINTVTGFVGAVAPGMGKLAPFIGCLAALQVASFKANLIEAMEPNSGRVARGCRPGCANSDCQNGGRCLERWNGQYRCYCWSTAFVGRLCDRTVSRALYGTGGVLLEFPLARSVAVIGGKFGLMSHPRDGDLILHIDGTKTDVAIVSGASQQLLLVVRSRSAPEKEYRISGSLANLQPPFLVRFWLWSDSNRLQLQLNDRQPVLGQWILHQVRAQGVNIGDPTSINRRASSQVKTFNHFRGCLYNLQIFVKGSEYPIELSDRSPEKTLEFATKDQCPAFAKAIPAEQDMNNSTEVGGVKEDSGTMKWLWYRIVLGILGAMLLCIFIVAFVYTYHACKKRSRRQKMLKGTYSQITYTQSSSVERPNGIKRTSASPTASPQHSVASTHLTGTPYKIPYRPPYVATSLVIRDGKHMAHIDSDVDLAESESELQ